ncbi:MAG TPA: JAB domain-containing protein, partial [Clostridia bacterium]|nr:JAB domain-containing protein [Clostridia bacterium]
VLVHNHPSNNATPSLQDKTLTEQVCVALSVIGITLEDHIIIAKGGYFSFKDSHWLENIVNGQISLSGGKIKDIRY